MICLLVMSLCERRLHVSSAALMLGKAEDFSKDLLENIVEVYKTGKGYENIIREMRMPVSRVQTVIKKLKMSDEEKATITSADKQDCLRKSGVAVKMHKEEEKWGNG